MPIVELTSIYKCMLKLTRFVFFCQNNSTSYVDDSASRLALHPGFGHAFDDVSPIVVCAGL